MVLLGVVQDNTLTIGEIVSGIPHDGPAVLVYVMLVGFGLLIWWGNRNSGRGKRTPPASRG
ncbi:MAG TPA: hypothetical protein VFZ69_08055 [Longimicrobiales bacterium]